MKRYLVRQGYRNIEDRWKTGKDDGIQEAACFKAPGGKGSSSGGFSSIPTSPAVTGYGSSAGIVRFVVWSIRSPSMPRAVSSSLR